MIDPELLAKLNQIEEKAEKAYQAAEKVRTYLFWKGVITTVLVLLPLVGLAFVIPSFLREYTKTLTSLGL